jgi:NADH:ubiquinone oxidoreductase subunit 3 (subunit A)
LFDDQKNAEYINGVLTFSLILVCFFLLWAIILVVLMCMGKRRVGFLSGAPYEMHLEDKTVPNPRVMRGRIVFALCGMLFITFTFLLIFLGIANLSQTTAELANGAGVRVFRCCVFGGTLLVQYLTNPLILYSQLGSDILADSGSLLRRFKAGAEAADKARDVAVEVLKEVFDIDSLNASNWNQPNNMTLNVTFNSTLPPALVAGAKYVVNNTDFRQRASEVVARLDELGDMIAERTAELYGRYFNWPGRCCGDGEIFSR